MGLPVIFLTFANDEDNHLSLLDMERKKISELLIPLESQQHFQLFREPTATTEDIFKYLSLFKDRLAIFHYGGHADSDQLFLQEEAANAQGIAQLLKQQQNLQLVFLNGCSTKAQVSLLLALGIPVVIATSAPINDKKATNFAIQFYQALSQQHSIKEAFEIASAFLKTKGIGVAEHYRGVRRKDLSEATFPWGLYTADQEVAALNYKLPNQSASKIIIQAASNKYTIGNVRINEKLTEMLLEALSTYSDDLEFYQFQAAKGKKVDIRKIRRAIMDCLPSPVGEQIRKLFAADPDALVQDFDTISTVRLEQLMVSYLVLTELINATLLGQLWDEVVRLPDFSLKEIPESFKTFFLSESGGASNSNLNLIQEILNLFKAHQLVSFIEELEDLTIAFQEDSLFKEAYEFMENLVTIFSQKTSLSAEELKHFCLVGEVHLGHIFDKLGFCAKYKLTTIKGIDIIKARHQTVSYRHYKVPLDNVTAGYLDIEEIYPGFTDANSVLLEKETENTNEYLSLSPFIIDENALKGEKKSKIYFFSHYEKVTDSFHYNFVNNREDKLIISDNNYPDIKKEMESFFQNLFNLKIQQL